MGARPCPALRTPIAAAAPRRNGIATSGKNAAPGWGKGAAAPAAAAAHTAAANSHRLITIQVLGYGHCGTMVWYRYQLALLGRLAIRPEVESESL